MYIYTSVYEQISTAKHSKKLQVWSRTNIPLFTCELHTPALAEMLLLVSIHYPTVGDVSFPWSTIMTGQSTPISEGGTLVGVAWLAITGHNTMMAKQLTL